MSYIYQRWNPTYKIWGSSRVVTDAEAAQIRARHRAARERNEDGHRENDDWRLQEDTS